MDVVLALFFLLPLGVACGGGLLADRACRGNPLRLSALALGLAAAASVVLLLLPHRGVTPPPGQPLDAGIIPDAIRYSPRLGPAAFPVAAALATLLVQLAVRGSAGRPWERALRALGGIVGSVTAIAVTLLAYVMSVTGIGVLYLPAIAALAAAAVRAWSRPH